MQKILQYQNRIVKTIQIQQPDMATVLNFRCDLALVNVAHSRRNEVSIGVIERTEFFAASLALDRVDT